MKKIYKISSDYEESRLDRWFKNIIGKVPQSLIQKYLRKGKIKVNSKKVKSSYKLKKNDNVVLHNIKVLLPKPIKSKITYKPTKKDLTYSSDIFVEDNEK